MTNREIQMIVLLNLVSNDPDSNTQPLLSEEEQNTVYKRFKGFGECEVTHMIKRTEEVRTEYLRPDWEYIFSCIEDKSRRDKLIELFQTLDKED